MSVEDNSAGATELVYAGFRRRLGAYAIDFAILAPKNLVYTSRDAFLVRMIVGTLIALLFEIYLVKASAARPAN
jgi:hypothetical protein